MKLKLLEFSFPATYANDICKFSDTVSFSAIYLLIVKAVCDNTDIVRRRRPAAGKKSQNSLYGLQYFYIISLCRQETAFTNLFHQITPL